MSGVVGVIGQEKNAAEYAYFMLYALQHRGQQSAGIASFNDGLFDYYKESGFLNDVFDNDRLEILKGSAAVGHVRMAANSEGLTYPYLQPIVAGYKKGAMGIVHDGFISNAKEIKDELINEGYLFQSELDTEVIATLLAKNYKESMEQSLLDTVKMIKGSYALIVLTNDELYVARDYYGIKPLSIGKKDDKYLVASETVAFDSVGAEFVRDVDPGEILKITKDGIEEIVKGDPSRRKLGVFEMVYIARPDSYIDGKSIYSARRKAGAILAKENPTDADLVIGAPDSGTSFAIGYAEASGIPYSEGIIKNRYVGRTFIDPGQEFRELAVKIKLNPLKEFIQDKRLILVDDSIVRGTTMKRTVQMLRDAGAKEVHVRIGSPMVKYSSNLMMDTPTREELIAANYSLEEIKDMIGADSLYYISLDGLYEALGGHDFSEGCFTGNFPEGTL
ncbi:MAG: amidophosphoribosyltransferase [Finegoldia sp.]|nr:amidophosphoribosyltransferase [Finegoldia sp.]